MRNKDQMISELKDILHYEPEAGEFRWVSGSMAGEPAGFPKDGYIVMAIDGIQWRAHILAWVYMTGGFPPDHMEIDHRDRNRANNKWTNLRLVTRSQNGHNKGLLATNTSGFRGVSWKAARKRWHARLMVENQLVFQGDYASFDEACAARKAAEEKYVGEFVGTFDPIELDIQKQSGRPIDKANNVRETWSDPVLRQQQSQRLKESLAKPEAKAKQIAANRLINSDPERRAAHAARTSNLRWITDGVKNSRVPKDTAIPVGWRFGRA